MKILTRRTLLAALGAMTAGAPRLSSAQESEAVNAMMATLRSLRWDRREAERLWRQPGGPRFEVIDYVDMTFGGKVYRRPVPLYGNLSESAARGVSLTYEQVAEVREVLGAISVYFRNKGMAAPMLPMANDKFYVFVVGDMGDIAGATGDASGLKPPAPTDPMAQLTPGPPPVMPPTVPYGVHLMLSATNYFTPLEHHPWATKITVAHELVHAMDRYMVVSGERAGSLDNVGNWWGEGNVDTAPQYSLKALGYDPEVTLKGGERNHAKNIGMRPYDYPLTLKGVPDRLPDWVLRGRPDIGPGDVVAAAASFYKYNATYFTASFWRFLMKEEAPVGSGRGGAPVPGDFELFAALREVVLTSTDIAKAAQNPDWMDNGVPALDSFLRSRHPTWGATGLYRAYPAFIAHWVEWPDQTLKSRKGLLAHPQWIDAMFMDGVEKHDIGIDVDITVELTVLPLAAKAIRFEIPQLGPTPQDYPPVTITVSIVDDGGQANAIDNIHVGLRGQCLGNGLSQPSPSRGKRVRRWASVKATPLKRRPVNDETILSFINVAPDPTSTRPVRIRVQVGLQVASTTGQVSYHPKPVETANGTIALPPSRSPKAPDVAPLVPIEFAAEETRVVLMKDADLVRMLNDALDINDASAIARDRDDGPANRQSAAANVMGAMSGAPFMPGSGSISDLAPSLMATVKTRPFEIILTIPKIQPGYVGSVSGGHVVAEWYESAYERFAEYGVSTSVELETDAVQVQITSSGDGVILGRFTADFDRGSQNTEATFRGRIEGKFSLGIANDEAAGDQQMPTDPSAAVPTDFFISAARAGMNTQDMAEFFRLQAAEMQASGGSGPPTSRPNVGGARGQAGVLDPGSCRVTRAEFDAWFEDLYGSQPMFTPAQRLEMKNQFLSAWEFTEQMICASRATP